MAKARTAINPQASFYDNLTALIKAAFAYVYEKNANFQHFTALYKVTAEGVKNGVLQALTELIEEGKTTGDVRSDADSCKAAENIWLITTGISGMLTANANYKYQDGLDTMLYGVEAILNHMKP